MDTAEHHALQTQNRLWIAERIEEDPSALANPPHERPGLVRFGFLVLCAGGGLIEDAEDLGDDLSRAVVYSLFLNRRRPLVVGGRAVTARDVGRLERLVGLAKVDAERKRLCTAGFRQLQVRFEQLSQGADIGSGEARDYAAAIEFAARKKRDKQNSEAKILGLLNLEGFENSNGRRIWHGNNVPWNRP